MEEEEEEEEGPVGTVGAAGVGAMVGRDIFGRILDGGRQVVRWEGQSRSWQAELQ